MAEIKKKPVQIVETVLRDAHQSLTPHSDSYMKILGRDFVSLKTDSKIPSFRCSLEVRIS